MPKPVSCPQPDSEPMMLVNDLAILIRNEMNRVSESAGVPAGYRKLLHELVRNNGCAQYDLCNATRLKAPTVSITLRKMEADGYIYREESPLDAREMRVFITKKGAEAENHNRKRLEEIDRAITDCFSADEKKQLLEMLIRARTALCKELGVELPHARRK